MNSISLIRTGIAEAEALASTFAYIGSFRQCCTTPSKCNIEKYLDQRYAKLGLKDDIEFRRNTIINPNEHIDRFLCRHANRLLEFNGETALLKPNHDQPGTEIIRWRWISLSLPPELILAATDPNASVRVRILDPCLQILDPTAHLHIHATAGITFGQIWNFLGVSADFSRIKTSPEGFSGTKEWKAWLCRALVARRILDIWMYRGLEYIYGIINRWPAVSYALRDLLQGKLSKTSRTTEASLEGFLRSPDSLIGLHSLFRRLGSESFTDHSLKNIEFDRRCIESIDAIRDFKCRERFRKLWTQVTRIRVMLYRHLVFDPVNAGLDEFDERFSRIGEYTGSGNSIRNEVFSAINLDSDLALEKLELRKSPGTFSKLREMHLQSQKQKRKGTGFRRYDLRPDESCPQVNLQLTWILHFIRSKKDFLKEQIRDHYVTAQYLSAAFRGCPELLMSIRGLDIAGRELSGPLWAVAAPLCKVRAESKTSCSAYPDIHPLKITVHVGEDFRHLLSGLRAIHEPFWWKLMKRGDRIGHAAALGWNPHDWCALYPRILQPRIERMFDIAWMLDFVSARNMDGVSGAVLESAHRELTDHLHSWDGDYDVREFITVVRNIGKIWLWDRIDGPYWHYFLFEGKYWKLLGELFSRYDLRQNDVIEVSTTNYGGLLEAIRDELAKLLAMWRTPIEINPSSNLLIGNLPHPLAQPLFHLDQFDRQEPRGLVLTLSADDPVTFSTCLADEFAYAWAGMVIGGGESPAYAQEWLQRAAEAARRAAF